MPRQLLRGGGSNIRVAGCSSVFFVLTLLADHDVARFRTEWASAPRTCSGCWTAAARKAKQILLPALRQVARWVFRGLPRGILNPTRNTPKPETEVEMARSLEATLIQGLLKRHRH